MWTSGSSPHARPSPCSASTDHSPSGAGPATCSCGPGDVAQHGQQDVEQRLATGSGVLVGVGGTGHDERVLGHPERRPCLGPRVLALAQLQRTYDERVARLGHTAPLDVEPRPALAEVDDAVGRRDADPEDVVGVVDQQHLGPPLGARGQRDGGDHVVGVDVQHHVVVRARQVAQRGRPVDEAPVLGVEPDQRVVRGQRRGELLGDLALPLAGEAHVVLARGVEPHPVGQHLGVAAGAVDLR